MVWMTIIKTTKWTFSDNGIWAIWLGVVVVSIPVAFHIFFFCQIWVFGVHFECLSAMVSFCAWVLLLSCIYHSFFGGSDKVLVMFVVHSLGSFDISRVYANIKKLRMKQKYLCLHFLPCKTRIHIWKIVSVRRPG